jgi:hypothetical protein
MQFWKPLKADEKKISFFTCSPRLVSHSDTLHQQVNTGKEAEEMTQQIKTFFHTHQGVFMWNETGRDVHESHLLLDLNHI